MTTAKKSTARKSAGKKVTAKKNSARKAGARKALAKKSATKKAATKKSASKNSAATSTKSVGAKTVASPTVRKSLAKYRSKRDFEITSEPSGNKAVRGGKALVFVIQKHEASHLHFDLRLEVDGVMKSWAVPKGPNVDPSVKRLAMEVEDHPIAYNTFEGTIPQGEYGGGTVMLWDNGTYSPDEVNAGESDNDAAARALKAGKLAFTFHGRRLNGSFALVRTRRGESHAQWLLIKHKDEFAKEGRDIVAEVMTSVETGRRMEHIAARKKARSSRSASAKTVTAKSSRKTTLVRAPKRASTKK
ncbi:MAG: DNA polymerase ligase N-terminal domain-containing protein [Gemmatimonas sp.]